jgi:hypothetical protein
LLYVYKLYKNTATFTCKCGKSQIRLNGKELDTDSASFPDRMKYFNRICYSLLPNFPFLKVDFFTSVFTSWSEVR